MSKKDYVLIARGLAASKPKGDYLPPRSLKLCTSVWGATVATLADLLEIHEPKFNRKKFEKASGL